MTSLKLAFLNLGSETNWVLASSVGTYVRSFVRSWVLQSSDVDHTVGGWWQLELEPEPEPEPEEATINAQQLNHLVEAYRSGHYFSLGTFGRRMVLVRLDTFS